MRLLALVIAISTLLACGCGGGGNELPSALARYSEGHEVTRFTGYSVSGLTLYRVALVGVSDLDRVSVVGVEEEGEGLVSGEALFLRMRGELRAEELARRAFDTLLGAQGHRPLSPDSERVQFATEEEWALVRAPAVENGSLTFWALQGSMSPEVVRHQVDLESGRVETTSARELVPEERDADEEDAFCEPLAACGCWVGCARFVADGDHFRVVDGAHERQIFDRRSDCTTDDGDETCRRVCDADGPEATCRDGLVPREEECGEACPPTEAPYHCEAAGEGCFRVAHPRRAAGD